MTAARPAGRDLGRGPRCVPRRRRRGAWRRSPQARRQVATLRGREGRAGRAARRASRTPWEMLCHRWSSPSSAISPERRSALRTGHMTRTRKRSTSRRSRAARRSARASALVVSIWLVASRSRTSARVPGVESIRARMLSLAGAAVTQKSGTSRRSTITPGYVERSAWLRMLPQAAFSWGTLPITSTSTLVERKTRPITDPATASSRPFRGPKASTPTAAMTAATMSLRRTRW